MKKVSIAWRYVLPAAVIGGLIAFCLSLPFRAPRQSDESLETIELPHGQCLVAVVEAEGVYLGNHRIPFDQFGAVFDSVYRKRVDWAIVFGSRESRYGDAVKLYSKLYEALGNRITLVTYPVKSGTRWKAIESLGRWGWLPEASEQ